MNNSYFAIENSTLSLEETIDNSVLLREKEGELVRIIEALRAVGKTKEWSTLKNLVFDSLTETLTTEIHKEARKDNPDVSKLNRLSGQLKWSEKYSDLSKLEDSFRLELSNVRKKLYGTSKEKPGTE